MLAAYIADPRIGAIADFYMPETKDRQWQKERMEAFEEACDLAVQKGAELVLLAGSVFAEEYARDGIAKRLCRSLLFLSCILGFFFRSSKIKCTDEVIYNRDFPCLGFFVGMGNFDTVYKLP